MEKSKKEKIDNEDDRDQEPRLPDVSNKTKHSPGPLLFYLPGERPVDRGLPETHH